MPQPFKTDRPTSIHVHLPASLMGRVYAVLYSSTEERIPLGAMQKFFLRAAEDLLTKLEVPNG